MQIDLKNLPKAELEAKGYSLYEAKEKLLVQLEQINRTIMIIRNELDTRAQTEIDSTKESSPKPVKQIKK
jgi:hypothetical protein